MFLSTLKTVIDRNVDINTHLQNLNTSVASFPHRDIHHQRNDIEIKLYKITYSLRSAARYTSVGSRPKT